MAIQYDCVIDSMYTLYQKRSVTYLYLEGRGWVASVSYGRYESLLQLFAPLSVSPGQRQTYIVDGNRHLDACVVLK